MSSSRALFFLFAFICLLGLLSRLKCFVCFIGLFSLSRMVFRLSVGFSQSVSFCFVFCLRLVLLLVSGLLLLSAPSSLLVLVLGFPVGVSCSLLVHIFLSDDIVIYGFPSPFLGLVVFVFGCGRFVLAIVRSCAIGFLCAWICVSSLLPSASIISSMAFSSVSGSCWAYSCRTSSSGLCML